MKVPSGMHTSPLEKGVGEGKRLWGSLVTLLSFFSSGVAWGGGFETESLCSLDVQELIMQTRLTLTLASLLPLPPE